MFLPYIVISYGFYQVVDGGKFMTSNLLNYIPNGG